MSETSNEPEVHPLVKEKHSDPFVDELLAEKRLTFIGVQEVTAFETRQLLLAGLIDILRARRAKRTNVDYSDRTMGYRNRVEISELPVDAAVFEYYASQIFGNATLLTVTGLSLAVEQCSDEKYCQALFQNIARTTELDLTVFPEGWDDLCVYVRDLLSASKAPAFKKEPQAAA